jgi:phosphomannomutase / phosphoglucomutase
LTIGSMSARWQEHRKLQLELVRASSNKVELVVVVASSLSEVNMRAIFAKLDAHLSTYPEIGEYNQKH